MYNLTLPHVYLNKTKEVRDFLPRLFGTREVVQSYQFLPLYFLLVERANQIVNNLTPKHFGRSGTGLKSAWGGAGYLSSVTGYI